MAAPRFCSSWLTLATAATSEPMLSGLPGCAAAKPGVASNKPAITGTAQIRPYEREAEAPGVRLMDKISYGSTRTCRHIRRAPMHRGHKVHNCNISHRLHRTSHLTLRKL